GSPYQGRGRSATGARRAGSSAGPAASGRGAVGGRPSVGPLASSRRMRASSAVVTFIGTPLCLKASPGDPGLSLPLPAGEEGAPTAGPRQPRPAPRRRGGARRDILRPCDPHSALRFLRRMRPCVGAPAPRLSLPDLSHARAGGAAGGVGGRAAVALEPRARAAPVRPAGERAEVLHGVRPDPRADRVACGGALARGRAPQRLRPTPGGVG